VPDRERWRRVRRAAGYQVSDRGRARSVKRTLSDGRECGGQLLVPVPDRDGYLRVSIAGVMVPLHVLVLEAFVSARPAGMEGCHGAGGQQDNSLANLRWDTHQENERDKGKREREIGKVIVSPPSRIVTLVARELAS
jgi:hypothetical protein